MRKTSRRDIRAALKPRSFVIVRQSGESCSSPIPVRSVRQHLGAIRGLFDHLLAGGVVPMNPASSVPGPQDRPTKTTCASWNNSSSVGG